MAKWKKQEIGSVVKGRDGKPDYLKIRETVTLNKGDILNLESQKSKRESLQQAISSGKLDAEFGAKLLEQVEKMPEFIRFSVTKSEKIG